MWHVDTEGIQKTLETMEWHGNRFRKLIITWQMT